MAIQNGHENFVERNEAEQGALKCPLEYLMLEK